MKSEALLIGRIFDDRGNRMSPSHARKGGVKYRYYLSSALLQGQAERAGSIRRVPAAEIEALVARSVREHLKPSAPIDDRSLINTHVARVEVQPEQLVIQLAQATRQTDRQSGQRRRTSCMSRGARRRQRDAVRSSACRSCPAATRSSDPVGDPRHLGRIDRARAPLARRTYRRCKGECRKHREARAVQRAASQHDHIARVPRARPCESCHRGRLPRGMGVTRLRDAPAEWSRQHAMLGLGWLMCPRLAVSLAAGCRARNGFADARDKGAKRPAKTNCPVPETKCAHANPPIGGLFDESPEHSVRAGMRGGGRSRSRTILCSSI